MPWAYTAIVFAVSVFAALSLYPSVIRRLKKAGITGKDMNKPDKPHLPEMGGLAIVASFGMGVLTAIGFVNLQGSFHSLNTVLLLASFSSVATVAMIGVFDDLLDMKKAVKILVPIFAALPLVAVRAGVTFVVLPMIGRVDFGLIYPLVIVPIGMTGAANATNILAGYNGLEVGLGLIASTALAIVAYTTGAYDSFIVLVSLIGPLIVTLFYNWYPARVFIGDVGTLSIGAVLCAACVLGNFETAGVLVMLPHGIDFCFKIRYRWPSATWGEFRDGKLHCPEGPARGLAQLILKITGGLTEVRIVLVLLFVELLCAGTAVALYAKF